QTWREYYVGACCLICLQACDGVRQVGTSVEVVLGTCRDYDVPATVVRPLAGRPHSFRGQLELVDRILRVAAEVLHREPRPPGINGVAGRRGHALGVVGEAVLQVRREREWGGGRQLSCMSEHLVTTH